LVDHHPRQRCPIALDAVLATCLVNFGRPRSLEHAFEPAVAAHTFEFGLVFAMKMAQIPACKTGFVQRNHLVHLGRAGSALGDLAQSPVQQPLQPVNLVKVDVTAKTGLAFSRQLNGLTLSQPAFIPANICLFESHLPVLLHVASSADRCALHRTPQTGQPICSRQKFACPPPTGCALCALTGSAGNKTGRTRNRRTSTPAASNWCDPLH
jgi:hypothetical protein